MEDYYFNSGQKNYNSIGYICLLTTIFGNNLICMPYDYSHLE